MNDDAARWPIHGLLLIVLCLIPGAFAGAWIIWRVLR